MGEEDLDNNLIIVEKYKYDEQNSIETDPKALMLPADSYRDLKFMEWLVSVKDPEDTTNADFEELLNRNYKFSLSISKS
jgi:hypothetical protein